MGNFYGGKEGRSFVVKKEYASIKEMVDNFKLGPSYKEVNFDEYVLINTENKNNPENGKLFRRGYDFDSTRKIEYFTLTPVKTLSDVNAVLSFEKSEIEAGGAVYIGTIVGPAGRAPQLRFEKYTEVMERGTPEKGGGAVVKEVKMSDAAVQTLDGMQTHLNSLYPGGVEIVEEVETRIDYIHVTEDLEDGTVVHYYFYFDDMLYADNPEVSIGWFLMDTPPIFGYDSYKPGDHNLINTVTYDTNEDGTLKYETDEDGYEHLIVKDRQDTIDWIYVTVRNENMEDSTAYLGFRMPVPMVEFEAETVDAYYNRTSNTHEFTNLNLVKRNQLQDEILEHPFYSRWHISIPKGIKGDAIRGIRVIDISTHKDKDKVVTLDLDENGKIQYNEDGTVKAIKYVETDSTNEDRCIFVYDYYNYERIKEGDHYIIYAGDFNILSEFNIGTDGTVERTYTHTDSITQEHLIKWINKVDFANDGTVTITFNNSSIHNGELKYPQLMNWITKFEIDKSTGDLVIEMNNDNLDFDVDAGAVDGKLSYPGYLKTVNRIEYEAETQRLRAYYNTSEEEYISDKFAFFMAAPDDNSATTKALQEELEVSGVWFITQEV